MFTQSSSTHVFFFFDFIVTAITLTHPVANYFAMCIKNDFDFRTVMVAILFLHVYGYKYKGKVQPFQRLCKKKYRYFHSTYISSVNIACLNNTECSLRKRFHSSTNGFEFAMIRNVLAFNGCEP